MHKLLGRLRCAIEEHGTETKDSNHCISNEMIFIQPSIPSVPSRVYDFTFPFLQYKCELLQLGLNQREEMIFH